MFMSNECRQRQDRVFTIELESKGQLKNVSLTNGSGDGVLVEGTIGGLVRAAFSEGVVLEVVGESGVLRIDLDKRELESAANESSRVVG
jgi:hypothetical protein